MSGGHVHHLAGGGASSTQRCGPLHALAPEAKVLGAVAFVFAVAWTPGQQYWAFAVSATLVAGIAVVGRVPFGFMLRRLRLEIPFVAFALLLPVVGRGPRVDVVGLSLSEPGLHAGWNIVAKATLGVAVVAILSATTAVPELLAGLERLRVPRRLVAITGFMVRYGDVLAGELHRMRIARMSRGHDPRWLWQARAVAASVGTLFVRSYERGERVYLAMESRGFTGTMPVRAATANASDWVRCLALPAVAAVVAVTARLAA